MSHTPKQLLTRLAHAERLWLFLDYDGTLADFAPTPSQAASDPEVVAVLDRLAQRTTIRLVIISGRALSQVRQLVPNPSVLLAGTYGIELQLPDGTLMQRADQRAIRPSLDRLKPAWEQLLAQRRGFFLEDKGWALALHARFTSEQAAHDVLNAAAALADELASSADLRVRHDRRFLEIGPTLADKSCAVEFILDRWAWPDAQLVYVGDDAHDEAAFEVIKQRGGLTLLVAASSRPTRADARLASPTQTRDWLAALANDLERRGGPADHASESSWQTA